jgi:hypothetical protein
MSGHFTSRLPPGHAARSFTRSAALAFLRADPLLSPVHPGAPTVADCREQCAALMWLRSAGYSAVAVRQLPPVARITLCNVMQVPTQPSGIQSQSDRITQAVTAALAGAAVAVGGPGAAAAPAAAGAQGQHPLQAAAGGGLGAMGPAAAAAVLGGAAQPPAAAGAGPAAGGGGLHGGAAAQVPQSVAAAAQLPPA